MGRHYSNWIDAYLEYTRHSEAPEAFHKWTAIGAIAGALRRRVWIDMGYFKWYPNFFLIFVAPPGIVSKSTTADIGMSLLRQVPNIKFGPTNATWQGLITRLVESKEEVLLPDGSYLPMTAVTIVASELGTFLRPDNGEMIDVMVDLWDGKDVPFEKFTKGGGQEVIENPWIQLIGCTTPAWIAQNFTDYFIGGGFASRSLFVFAEHKRALVAYPHTKLELVHSERAAKLVDDLKTIASLEGTFTLTPEAIAWGTRWYENHYSSDNPLREDQRFGGYFARKQTHIHKTAMALSVATRDDLVITPQILEWAEREVTLLEPNMTAVFGEMNKEKITQLMALVLKKVREHGRIKKEALYREFVTSMGFTTFRDCLDGLFAGGLIGLEQDTDGFYVNYKGARFERALRANSK